MLSQGICNSPSVPSEPNDYSERYKRDIYDDLQVAIGLLKEFDAKINRMHPQVAVKIRDMMRSF
jgi:hypothetical protein